MANLETWDEETSTKPIRKTEPNSKANNENTSSHLPRSKKSNKLLWYIIGGAVIAVLLLFTLIIPAIEGYSTYRALKASGVPDKYISNMQGLVNDNNNLRAQLTQAQSDLQTANSARTSAEANLSQTQDQVSKDTNALHGIIDMLQQNQTQSKEQQDTLQQELTTAQNTLVYSANRLCCIAKYTNDAIKAYVINDDKVSCVSEGGTAINC